MYEVSCLSRFARTSPSLIPMPMSFLHNNPAQYINRTTASICCLLGHIFQIITIKQLFQYSLCCPLSVGLAVTWLGSPWPLSLTKVILPSMTHTNAHMENVVHEYSFPKFGGIMSHFLFSFTTCVIRCGVARFDLGPLSLGLGPHHPPALPCPWTLSLDRVILAYCSLPVPEYEWHYYTSALLNVLHISHGCLYSGTMCTSG